MLKIRKLWRYYLDEKTFLRSFSSHLALVCLSGFFPFLLMVMAVAGLFIDRQVIINGGFNTFFPLLPEPLVAFLIKVILDITSSVKVAVFSIGFLALFIAVDAMFRDAMFVLNYVYGYKEHRSLIKRILLSLLLCLLGVIFVFFLTNFLFLSNQFVEWLRLHVMNHDWIFTMLSWRWPLALSFTVLLVFGAYYLLPAHTSFNWKKLVPGTLFFSGMFLLFGWGFNYYLSSFAAYNTTYGLLGAIVLLLVYLKLTALFFILGGVVNKFYD